MKASDAWLPPPAQLVLGPGEAHLWRVSLSASDERLPAFARTLSPDERQRADRFHFAMHRRRFVIRRGVLRALLGQYAGHAPADLEFAYGPHGKPSLAAPPAARGIFFNASQSGEFALYAVTRAGEIGVDVERVRAIPEWRQIVRHILTQEGDALPPATLAGFFREWTRHEARLKAAGLGLGSQPASGRTWELRSLSIEADLVAAIALPVGVRQVTCWRWCGNFTGA